MQAVIDDTVAIYVTDDTPNAEPRYRARFHFHPNSISIASTKTQYIFKGFMGASTDVLRVEINNPSPGVYQVRTRLITDANTWENTGWYTISASAFNSIEVDWRAATGAGANDGYVTLWIDGIQKENKMGIDNDTWRIDRARLGALATIDAGTSGIYFFDAFESRRQTYIGP